MALTACKECGKEVSTKAAACPNCGAVREKRGSGCLKVIVAFILLFLGYVFFTATMTGMARQDARPAPASTP